MISIIAAVADNGVIGDRNDLLWHITEDMRYFRRVTTGHPVVMGRRTYESMGRPLPGRDNVVVTRADRHIKGCRVVHSLDEAYALFDPAQELFVIGGGEIYRQALTAADRLYLTRVHRAYAGDTHFPEWDPEAWQLVERESFARGEQFPWPFDFEVYERRK